MWVDVMYAISKSGHKTSHQIPILLHSPPAGWEFFEVPGAGAGKATTWKLPSNWGENVLSPTEPTDGLSHAWDICRVLRHE